MDPDRQDGPPDASDVLPGAGGHHAHQGRHCGMLGIKPVRSYFKSGELIAQDAFSRFIQVNQKGMKGE